MINKYNLKTIEDIAIQYIATLEPQEKDFMETINTVEDKNLSKALIVAAEEVVDKLS